MASFRFSALFLGFPLLFLLISPTQSLNCSSKNFTNNILYTNCTDLPTLSSYLYWTYEPTNSSLSILFIAPPAKPTGWIAWAINPTGTGMAGSQALIAFQGSNGTMAVKTYNISSYTSVVESKLSFDVLNPRAEYSGGLMMIFATLALPKNMTTVSQVWQVGASVTSGVPMKHDFGPANLNSKGSLELVKVAQSNGTTTGGGSGGGSSNTTSGGPSGSDKAGAASMFGQSLAGFYVTLLLLGSFVVGF
ncbi:unnamed protein product [Ilex paraguariensis]|uniref:DOMON domain-containing protein n=1 Tax=Ilex paraguariensis TaxID=185542 RepID=A0ABC8RBE9_9AQUA